jgi:hypothetical protein
MEGNGTAFRRWLVVLYILVIAFGVFQIVPALNIYRRTGLLIVDADSDTAQISVTQENHQATVIGTGNARVRLAPGTYQILATDSGTRASAVVTVSKEHTTHSSLNLSAGAASNAPVRTVSDVNFEGTDALINTGLATSQLSEVEQYFFQYKPTANTVAINTDTVAPGPHDPNKVSPFTINFTVAIDSVSYKATISYTDINNADLQLFNLQTGKQVFSSKTAASQQ